MIIELLDDEMLINIFSLISAIVQKGGLWLQD